MHTKVGKHHASSRNGLKGHGVMKIKKRTKAKVQKKRRIRYGLSQSAIAMFSTSTNNNNGNQKQQFNFTSSSTSSPSSIKTNNLFNTLSTIFKPTTTLRFRSEWARTPRTNDMHRIMVNSTIREGGIGVSKEHDYEEKVRNAALAAGLPDPTTPDAIAQRAYDREQERMQHNKIPFDIAAANCGTMKRSIRQVMMQRHPHIVDIFYNTPNNKKTRADWVGMMCYLAAINEPKQLFLMLDNFLVQVCNLPPLIVDKLGYLRDHGDITDQVTYERMQRVNNTGKYESDVGHFDDNANNDDDLIDALEEKQRQIRREAARNDPFANKKFVDQDDDKNGGQNDGFDFDLLRYEDEDGEDALLKKAQKNKKKKSQTQEEDGDDVDGNNNLIKQQQPSPTQGNNLYDVLDNIDNATIQEFDKQRQDAKNDTLDMQIFDPVIDPITGKADYTKIVTTEDKLEDLTKQMSKLHPRDVLNTYTIQMILHCLCGLSDGNAEAKRRREILLSNMAATEGRLNIEFGNITNNKNNNIAEIETELFDGVLTNAKNPKTRIVAKKQHGDGDDSDDDIPLFDNNFVTKSTPILEDSLDYVQSIQTTKDVLKLQQEYIKHQQTLDDEILSFLDEPLTAENRSITFLKYCLKHQFSVTPECFDLTFRGLSLYIARDSYFFRLQHVIKKTYFNPLLVQKAEEIDDAEKMHKRDDDNNNQDRDDDDDEVILNEEELEYIEKLEELSRHYQSGDDQGQEEFDLNQRIKNHGTVQSLQQILTNGGKTTRLTGSIVQYINHKRALKKLKNKTKRDKMLYILGKDMTNESLSLMRNVKGLYMLTEMFNLMQQYNIAPISGETWCYVLRSYYHKMLNTTTTLSKQNLFITQIMPIYKYMLLSLSQSSSSSSSQDNGLIKQKNNSFKQQLYNQLNPQALQILGVLAIQSGQLNIFEQVYQTILNVHQYQQDQANSITSDPLLLDSNNNTNDVNQLISPHKKISNNIHYLRMLTHANSFLSNNHPTIKTPTQFYNEIITNTLGHIDLYETLTTPTTSSSSSSSSSWTNNNKKNKKLLLNQNYATLSSILTHIMSKVKPTTLSTTTTFTKIDDLLLLNQNNANIITDYNALSSTLSHGAKFFQTDATANEFQNAGKLHLLKQRGDQLNDENNIENDDIFIIDKYGNKIKKQFNEILTYDSLFNTNDYDDNNNTKTTTNTIDKKNKQLLLGVAGNFLDSNDQLDDLSDDDNDDKNIQKQHINTTLKDYKFKKDNLLYNRKNLNKLLTTKQLKLYKKLLLYYSQPFTQELNAGTLTSTLFNINTLFAPRVITPIAKKKKIINNNNATIPAHKKKRGHVGYLNNNNQNEQDNNANGNDDDVDSILDIEYEEVQLPMSQLSSKTYKKTLYMLGKEMEGILNQNNNNNHQNNQQQNEQDSIFINNDNYLNGPYQLDEMTTYNNIIQHINPYLQHTSNKKQYQKLINKIKNKKQKTNQILNGDDESNNTNNSMNNGNNTKDINDIIYDDECLPDYTQGNVWLPSPAVILNDFLDDIQQMTIAEYQEEKQQQKKLNNNKNKNNIDNENDNEELNDDEKQAIINKTKPAINYDTVNDVITTYTTSLNSISNLFVDFRHNYQMLLSKLQLIQSRYHLPPTDDSNEDNNAFNKQNSHNHVDYYHPTSNSEQYYDHFVNFIYNQQNFDFSGFVELNDLYEPFDVINNPKQREELAMSLKILFRLNKKKKNNKKNGNDETKALSIFDLLLDKNNKQKNNNDFNTNTLSEREISEILSWSTTLLTDMISRGDFTSTTLLSIIMPNYYEILDELNDVENYINLNLTIDQRNKKIKNIYKLIQEQHEEQDNDSSSNDITIKGTTRDIVEQALRIIWKFQHTHLNQWLITTKLSPYHLTQSASYLPDEINTKKSGEGIDNITQQQHIINNLNTAVPINENTISHLISMYLSLPPSSNQILLQRNNLLQDSGDNTTLTKSQSLMSTTNSFNPYGGNDGSNDGSDYLSNVNGNNVNYFNSNSYNVIYTFQFLSYLHKHGHVLTSKHINTLFSFCHSLSDVYLILMNLNELNAMPTTNIANNHINNITRQLLLSFLNFNSPMLFQQWSHSTLLPQDNIYKQLINEYIYKDVLPISYNQTKDNIILNTVINETNTSDIISSSNDNLSNSIIDTTIIKNNNTNETTSPTSLVTNNFDSTNIITTHINPILIKHRNEYYLNPNNTNPSNIDDVIEKKHSLLLDNNNNYLLQTLRGITQLPIDNTSGGGIMRSREMSEVGVLMNFLENQDNVAYQKKYDNNNDNNNNTGNDNENKLINKSLQQYKNMQPLVKLNTTYITKKQEELVKKKQQNNTNNVVDSSTAYKSPLMRHFDTLLYKFAPNKINDIIEEEETSSSSTTTVLKSIPTSTLTTPLPNIMVSNIKTRKNTHFQSIHGNPTTTLSKITQITENIDDKKTKQEKNNIDVGDINTIEKEQQKTIEIATGTLLATTSVSTIDPQTGLPVAGNTSDNQGKSLNLTNFTLRNQFNPITIISMLSADTWSSAKGAGDKLKSSNVSPYHNGLIKYLKHNSNTHNLSDNDLILHKLLLDLVCINNNNVITSEYMNTALLSLENIFNHNLQQFNSLDNNRDNGNNGNNTSVLSDYFDSPITGINGSVYNVHQIRNLFQIKNTINVDTNIIFDGDNQKPSSKKNNNKKRQLNNNNNDNNVTIINGEEYDQSTLPQGYQGLYTTDEYLNNNNNKNLSSSQHQSNNNNTQYYDTTTTASEDYYTPQHIIKNNNNNLPQEGEEQDNDDDNNVFDKIMIKKQIYNNYQNVIKNKFVINNLSTHELQHDDVVPINTWATNGNLNYLYADAYQTLPYLGQGSGNEYLIDLISEDNSSEENENDNKNTKNTSNSSNAHDIDDFNTGHFAGLNYIKKRDNIYIPTSLYNASSNAQLNSGATNIAGALTGRSVTGISSQLTQSTSNNVLKIFEKMVAYAPAPILHIYLEYAVSLQKSISQRARQLRDAKKQKKKQKRQQLLTTMHNQTNDVEQQQQQDDNNSTGAIDAYKQKLSTGNYGYEETDDNANNNNNPDLLDEVLSGGDGQATVAKYNDLKNGVQEHADDAPAATSQIALTTSSNNNNVITLQHDMFDVNNILSPLYNQLKQMTNNNNKKNKKNTLSLINTDKILNNLKLYKKNYETFIFSKHVLPPEQDTALYSEIPPKPTMDDTLIPHLQAIQYHPEAQEPTIVPLSLYRQSIHNQLHWLRLFGADLHRANAIVALWQLQAGLTVPFNLLQTLPVSVTSQFSPGLRKFVKEITLTPINDNIKLNSTEQFTNIHSVDNNVNNYHLALNKKLKFFQKSKQSYEYQYIFKDLVPGADNGEGDNVDENIANMTSSEKNVLYKEKVLEHIIPSKTFTQSSYIDITSEYVGELMFILEDYIEKSYPHVQLSPQQQREFYQQALTAAEHTAKQTGQEFDPASVLTYQQEQHLHFPYTIPRTTPNQTILKELCSPTLHQLDDPLLKLNILVEQQGMGKTSRDGSHGGVEIIKHLQSPVHLPQEYNAPHFNNRKDFFAAQLLQLWYNVATVPVNEVDIQELDQQPVDPSSSSNNNDDNDNDDKYSNDMIKTMMANDEDSEDGEVVYGQTDYKKNHHVQMDIVDMMDELQKPIVTKNKENNNNDDLNTVMAKQYNKNNYLNNSNNNIQDDIFKLLYQPEALLTKNKIVNDILNQKDVSLDNVNNNNTTNNDNKEQNDDVEEKSKILFELIKKQQVNNTQQQLFVCAHHVQLLSSLSLNILPALPFETARNLKSQLLPFEQYFLKSQGDSITASYQHVIKDANALSAKTRQYQYGGSSPMSLQDVTKQ